MDPRLISMSLMAALVITLFIINFLSKSKEEKIDTLLNWVKGAVYEAEDSLGSGTGKVKLATVYKAAVEQFPWISKFFTYEEFDAKIVKPALSWLNEQMENPNIKKKLGLK